jgi:hypothetical protein
MLGILIGAAVYAAVIIRPFLVRRDSGAGNSR